MRKCSMKDCQNIAKHTVGFSAYALGHAQVSRNQLKGMFSLFVCDSHKASLKPDDLITTGGWERIQQELLKRNKALLDRHTIELFYRDVHGHL